jgi:hypothetical protein
MGPEYGGVGTPEGPVSKYKSSEGLGMPLKTISLLIPLHLLCGLFKVLQLTNGLYGFQ